MYVFADVPASKSKRRNIPMQKDTDDIHHHALVIAPNEIADRLYELCSNPIIRRDFVANYKSIKTFNLQLIYPVMSSIEHVTSYAVGNNRFSRHHDNDDRMLVFPISSTEFKNPAPVQNSMAKFNHELTRHDRPQCKRIRLNKQTNKTNSYQPTIQNKETQYVPQSNL